MICFPGAEHVEISAYAYRRRMTGVGLSYDARQRLHIQCPECDETLATGSLKAHLRARHHIEQLETLDKEPPEPQQPTSYTIEWPKTEKKRPCPCPVPSFPGQPASMNGMRQHFMRKYPDHTLCIRNEGSAPSPRCAACSMHVTYAALNTTHPNSKLCLKGQERKAKRARLAAVEQSKAVTFTALGAPIENVTSFCYLGRILCANNSDWPAVYKNLSKARQKWAFISHQQDD
ncbi:unknown protein [Seminavis robusta]|uniref:Uncharacterized protein n=1 Tax=Seminavis robusta TaxID=568900 RepID=A0A9N8DKM7_9STRA|nr:unknown protein [Seminavis robusta]|eukprot:Sro207_g086720.1 n/a (232) ;mRNA; f:3274-3969